MDLQELKTKYPLLISYMEAHNYSRQYIKHVKNEIKWNKFENYHWKTYDDIYLIKRVLTSGLIKIL
ncbi:MAG: hypothetical protein LBG80_02160 [Bacteroidales bacterium]|jgi:hypothetical protein|nr:hypothetical protein [Bacteroidales bacterium]